MTRNQLLLLLILVAVVGGAGLLLVRRQSASWHGGGAAVGQKLLPDLPLNDVAHIRIQQATNQLNLVKQDDLWRVRERGDYPANFAQVSEFLIKARDLKIVQSEQVGPSQLGRLELLPPGPATNTATLVELRDKAGQVIRALLLGKKHMKTTAPRPDLEDVGERGWPDGRYVMLAGQTGRVAVIADPLANLEPKPESWLNKDFFKVEKPRSVSVAFAAATNSWTLTRETESGQWKLADARPDEALDTGKASSATSGLGWPSFNDVLPADTPPASVGLETPTVVTLRTFDDFTYTLRIGAKTNDQYHLTLAVAAQLPKERTPGPDEKPEDKERLDKEFKDKTAKLADKLAQEKKLEGWVYRVSPWTFDSLLKPRAELLAEKKPEPKPAEPPPAAAGSGDAAKPATPATPTAPEQPKP